jgi:O-antigen ligase
MKLVNELLAQGLSHADIRQAVSQDKSIDSQKVEKYLANVADAPLVRQHRSAIVGFQLYLLTLNILAIGSMVWLGINEQPIYFAGAAVAALIAFACWYGVSRNLGSSYVGICMLTAMGSLQLVKMAKEQPTVVGVVLALNAILILYAAGLKMALFPGQGFFSTHKPAVAKS